MMVVVALVLALGALVFGVLTSSVVWLGVAVGASLIAALFGALSRRGRDEEDDVDEQMVTAEHRMARGHPARPQVAHRPVSPPVAPHGPRAQVPPPPPAARAGTPPAHPGTPPAAGTPGRREFLTPQRSYVPIDPAAARGQVPSTAAPRTPNGAPSAIPRSVPDATVSLSAPIGALPMSAPISGSGSQVQAPVAPPVRLTPLERVWVIDGRPRYHRRECGIASGNDAEEIPRAQAVEDGFIPCAICDPDANLQP